MNFDCLCSDIIMAGLLDDYDLIGLCLDFIRSVSKAGWETNRSIEQEGESANILLLVIKAQISHTDSDMFCLPFDLCSVIFECHLQHLCQF